MLSDIFGDIYTGACQEKTRICEYFDSFPFSLTLQVTHPPRPLIHLSSFISPQDVGLVVRIGEHRLATAAACSSVEPGAVEQGGAGEKLQAHRPALSSLCSLSTRQLAPHSSPCQLHGVRAGLRKGYGAGLSSPAVTMDSDASPSHTDPCPSFVLYAAASPVLFRLDAS